MNWRSCCSYDTARISHYSPAQLPSRLSWTGGILLSRIEKIKKPIALLQMRFASSSSTWFQNMLKSGILLLNTSLKHVFIASLLSHIWLSPVAVIVNAILAASSTLGTIGKTMRSSWPRERSMSRNKNTFKNRSSWSLMKTSRNWWRELQNARFVGAASTSPQLRSFLTMSASSAIAFSAHTQITRMFYSLKYLQPKAYWMTIVSATLQRDRALKYWRKVEDKALQRTSSSTLITSLEKTPSLMKPLWRKWSIFELFKKCIYIYDNCDKYI